MKQRTKRIWQTAQILGEAILLASLSACAGARGFFGMNSEDDRRRPISNPFGEYYSSPQTDPNQKVTLRTKKGERSVEVDIPSGQASLSDFVLPVSPAFREDGRSIASYSGSNSGSLSSSELNSNGENTNANSGVGMPDESYRSRSQSRSDREILSSLPQGSPINERTQREIETGLGLALSEDQSGPEGSASYLATIDHIKQLYRLGRFEAALLETDDAIRLYQTDPRLHQMRGTLLDRLGKGELALRSWNQALRFDPGNHTLKRFVERKQQKRSLAGQ